MQLKDVWFGVADFFEWTFQILPPLGNIPNLIFFIIGSVLFLYWLGQMVQHRRAGQH